MAGFVSDHILDRIRAAIDIVSVVREFLPLKKAGSTFKGLCPFHKEKTPSFVVNPERQIFKCFGCGVGGDVFSFVMKTENVDFPEAVEILAERAHVELPARGDAGPGTSSNEKDLIYRANDWAARLFHRWLMSGEAGLKAREYLQRRGVTEKTIADFQLGYSPDAWSALLDAGQAKEISPRILEKAGLALSRDQADGYYDRFRNRLMFPIYDERGRVIAFGARALDDSEPKYLNSPETPLFAKGRTLYGLDRAKDAFKSRRLAVVVEGYMDVIMAHQYGLGWTVGVLGTALTREHVRLLRRRVDTAAIVFDADTAGENSANRSIDAFAAEELGVRVVTLTDGLDPDAFLREKGAEAFVQIVAAAEDGLSFKLRRALDGVPEEQRRSVTLMAKALDDVLATVAMMPNAVAQSLEIKKITERTGVPEIALQHRVQRFVSSRRRWAAQTPAPETRKKGRDAEEELLEAMLSYPATVAYVCPRLQPEALRNPPIRELVSRLYVLTKAGTEITPAVLLAHTQDEGERAILERIIGEGAQKVENPENWCRDLLTGLDVREQNETSAKLNREKPVTRVLHEKMEAARASQRTRGILKQKEK